MGSYRSKVDIIADMLKAIGEGAKKTHIMYQSNLSYNLLCKYLAEIANARLIIFEAERQCYLPTSKGKNFLEKYKEYSRRNRHIERKLNDMRFKRKVLEELCSNKNYKGSSIKKRKDEALIFR